jgi:hypothetical protein
MFCTTVETTSAVFTDTVALPPVISDAVMVRVPEVPTAPVPVVVPPKPVVAPVIDCWSLRWTETTVPPTEPFENPIVLKELVLLIVAVSRA